MAYGPIMAADRHAAILHYTKNNGPMTAESFLLIDAGCEYKGYASDITRSYPASGRFTPHQRALYSAPLDVQVRIIEAIRPGVAWEDLHRDATRWIGEHLISLGIIQGNIEDCLAHFIPQLFFPHGLGHSLGLDVHDVGGYPEVLMSSIHTIAIA